MFIFAHCFNIPPSAIDLISIQRQVELSLVLFGFKLTKVIDHIAFNIIKVEIEFALIQVDQINFLNSSDEQ